jgi:hypothetical protein
MAQRKPRNEVQLYLFGSGETEIAPEQAIAARTQRPADAEALTVNRRFYRAMREAQLKLDLHAPAQ